MAMRATSTDSRSGKLFFRPWALLGILGVLLLIFFSKSLDPHQILFANDYPLGALVADCNHLPNRFTGTWREIAWLGGEAPAASPNITMLMLTLLSPVAYLKTYAPFTLLFLGFCAWLFFRQLNFHPAVCVLGGVAAGLNSHFFSIACWGLGNWSIVAGCAFLAMAALYSKSIPKVWERAVLAGLATGMVVMEGYDVGAIVSVYIGVFIAFHALNNEGPLSKRAFNAFLTEALVVLFAGFIAYHTMKTLVRTQVEGVASMEQDAETKKTRWNAATQWSLPKAETLQILVPGLFGYRLSGNIDHRDHSGAYWGLIGQDPRIAGLASDDPNERSNVVVSGLKLSEGYLTNLNTPDRFSRTAGMQAVTKKSGIYWRYSGSGECAGMMVSLLALFALANFFGKDRPLSKTERVAIGFWGGVAVFSLLAAWGRYGFVYQFLYMIPEVSTIRNPIKFLHPFHIAWIILAAYGMEILYRRYLRSPEKNSSQFFVGQIKDWWAKVAGFDRKWAIFMIIFVGVAALGTVILFVEQSALIRYLQEQSFAAPLPKQIAAFCLQRAGAFVVILAAGVVVMAAILSGAWAGSSSKWAWGALAALIILDLARADIPWVHYYDYKEKYELNSVTEFLLDKPWEHRVIGKLEPRGPGSGIQQGFGQLYFFWLQNDFPFHNIQTLDFAQAAHMPDLDRIYLKAFELSGEAIRNTDLRPAVRLWELTNTRYIVGTASSAEDLNRRFDPVHRRFKVVSRFNFPRLKPGISSAGDVGDMTIEPSEKGDYGIIEDTRALPRAKLYANWRTTTNDDETLKILADQNFEPWETVLVDASTPPPQPTSSSTADPGTVAITDYHPKNVRLKADVKAQSILLLNDRYDTDWHVLLDGAPVAMLRCNDIMRGVALPPGQHEVEFVFRPSLKTLYVSVSAIVIGIILAGYLVITRKPIAAPMVKATPTPTPPPTPAPPQATKPAPPQAKKQKGAGKAKK